MLTFWQYCKHDSCFYTHEPSTFLLGITKHHWHYFQLCTLLFVGILLFFSLNRFRKGCNSIFWLFYKSPFFYPKLANIMKASSVYSQDFSWPQHSNIYILDWIYSGTWSDSYEIKTLTFLQKCGKEKLLPFSTIYNSQFINYNNFCDLRFVFFFFVNMFQKSHQLCIGIILSYTVRNKLKFQKTLSVKDLPMFFFTLNWPSQFDPVPEVVFYPPNKYFP